MDQPDSAWHYYHLINNLFSQGRDTEALHCIGDLIALFELHPDDAGPGLTWILVAIAKTLKE